MKAKKTLSTARRRSRRPASIAPRAMLFAALADALEDILRTESRRPARY